MQHFDWLVQLPPNLLIKNVILLTLSYVTTWNLFHWLLLTLRRIHASWSCHLPEYVHLLKKLNKTKMNSVFGRSGWLSMTWRECKTDRLFWNCWAPLAVRQALSCSYSPGTYHLDIRQTIEASNSWCTRLLTTNKTIKLFSIKWCRNDRKISCKDEHTSFLKPPLFYNVWFWTCCHG